MDVMEMMNNRRIMVFTKRKKRQHAEVVVKTDAFADIEYVNEQTRKLCDEVRKISSYVDLTIEVDLRGN